MCLSLCCGLVCSSASAFADRLPIAHMYVYILEELDWLTCMVYSDSPLNAEAAELWGKDPEEFKRKVLARHRDIDDE